MFVAINSSAERTTAKQAARDDHYWCPECREEVVLKQGERVVWHFAHLPDSSCRHGVGETPRHREMKSQVEMRLRAVGFDIEYEVRITDEKQYQFADLVVNDPHVGPYVIECHASPMTGRTYEARVRFFNIAGFPVLMLWDHARAIREKGVGPLPERLVSVIQVGVEYRIHGGIVTATEDLGIAVHYTLAAPQTVDDDGVVRALHILPGTMRPAGWFDTDNGEQWRDASTPKFLREVRCTDQVPWETRIERTPDGLHIVRLGEAPTHEWSGVPSARNRVLLTSGLDSPPARNVAVTLPLFEMASGRVGDDRWS